MASDLMAIDSEPIRARGIIVKYLFYDSTGAFRVWVLSNVRIDPK